MNVVFAGGGTGGHLYPAIAIADALRGRAQIAFVGTADRLEATIVPNAGYPLTTISAKPLARKYSLAMVGGAFANLAGIAQSLRVLGRLRPDIVIATGGYVSFPLVVAARMRRRVPIALLEPNARPGLTNRMLAPLVDEVWGAFDDVDPRFAGKYVRTGVPVRESLRALPPHAEAMARLGLDPALRTLLAMGGSQGARSINDALVAVAGADALPQGWQVLLVAGERDAAEVARELAASPMASRAHAVAYLDKVADAYAAADVVLARAGASTLAELAAAGLPAMLVPYPFAAEDHQEANARAAERAGAAVVVSDADLHDRLASLMAETLRPARLDALRAAARARAQTDAVAAILARIDALLSRTKRE
jgi:UDP-N-acetylglucosamine--N-acetylmuramyl-(pentapeptide) pyrophosphoryl-undecaprenol N-acetylglucosamine transferase